MDSSKDIADLLRVYLSLLGEGKELLLKSSDNYVRLSKANHYKTRTLVYYQAKRLEKLGLIECVVINRAKFCKLTEKGKKLKEILEELEEERRKAEREEFWKRIQAALQNQYAMSYVQYLWS